MGNKSYLVTGAAGFIGSALAGKLVNAGHSVVTIDNLSTGFRENIPEKVDFIKGDCSDTDTIGQLDKKTENDLLKIRTFGFSIYGR